MHIHAQKRAHDLPQGGGGRQFRGGDGTPRLRGGRPDEPRRDGHGRGGGRGIDTEPVEVPRERGRRDTGPDQEHDDTHRLVRELRGGGGEREGGRANEEK